MKKTIFILAAALLIGAKSFAQAGDTTVLSKALGDSITMRFDAFEVNPVPVVFLSDTVRSMSWRAFDVTRKSKGFNTYVQLFNKYGNPIDKLAFNCPIPASIDSVWCNDPTPIDEYILSKHPEITLP